MPVSLRPRVGPLEGRWRHEHPFEGPLPVAMSGDSRRPTEQPAPASAIAGARIQYFQPFAAPFRGDSQRPHNVRCGWRAPNRPGSRRAGREHAVPLEQSCAVSAGVEKSPPSQFPNLALSSGAARNDRWEMLATSSAPRSAIQPPPPGRPGPATTKDRQHSTDFSFSQETVLLLS